jgi:hypothetical protein
MFSFATACASPIFARTSNPSKSLRQLASQRGVGGPVCRNQLAPELPPGLP